MWGREQREEKGVPGPGVDPSVLAPACRRAYYRVSGLLPIRLTPISRDEVATAVFDLSIPDPLLQPIAEGSEDTPLMERLRRIEDKLDLLLGASSIDVPSRLSGRDRQSIIFSGAGLSLDVTWFFAKRDAYKVEILLPPPYSRTLRAVAEAVCDAPADVKGDGLRNLPLALTYMEDEERDALVAYSYDLQRFALRTRVEGEDGPR
jgi:hypothetical protein